MIRRPPRSTLFPLHDALPIWSGDPRAIRVFDFGMRYAGSLHIVFGALAMFAFGVSALGWRRTTIFLVCAVPISLGSELIGTSTGDRKSTRLNSSHANISYAVF